MVLPIDSSTLLAEDLKKSGLLTTDLGAYVATEPELAAVGMRAHMYLDTPGVGSPGYVIPYYDIHGARAPFYRLKLFKPLPKGAKYLQPANTGSWVYFPKTFQAVLDNTLKGKSLSKVNGFDPVLIITEGEKKAAKACAEGFLAIALGGVYSWRTKVMVLPEGTQLLKDSSGKIIAKIGQGTVSPPTSDRRAALANGLAQIMDLIRQHKMQVVLAFDTDYPQNVQVQKACAELAFELRTNGIAVDHIRQLLLPGDKAKVGLDDYLLNKGPAALSSLLHECLGARSAYPRHPELKTLINSRMDQQMSRNDAKELSLLLLSDMDMTGQRMIEAGSDTPHYFDSRSKTLMPVNLMHHHNAPLHESKFGAFLYHHYDISQGDNKLMNWIAAGFTGEKPVGTVIPRSVIALIDEDRLALQLGDASYAIVSSSPKEPLSIVDNGERGLLFRSNQVEPLDEKLLVAKFKEQVAWLMNPKTKFEDLYWPASLKQFKFTRPTDWQVLSLLCYMSPWLLRWGGTQLPVELMVGEPGSGKSSCYSLRLQVLTGRPALRNQPTDIRDWYAGITTQDGLYVIDNIHFATKEIRQRLSDEICRIVTEPSPFVEMRKLFTTADVARMPVRTTFAMTAINQPFINADILQRSLIFELQAVGTDHASDWASQQLVRFGGRENWLAHQLAVLHLFLASVREGKWQKEYKSNHRLANFEQLFTSIGTLLRMPDLTRITGNLVRVAEDQVSEYDWTMQALKEFAYEYLPLLQKNPQRFVTCQDVAQWAMGKEDYLDNQIVTNAHRLTRYLGSHAFMVEKCAGFIKVPEKKNNRVSYRLIPVKEIV